ncbi:MAG: hypothetical protein ACYCPQ_09305, partial [Elusimicrobiota bacterium]
SRDTELVKPEAPDLSGPAPRVSSFHRSIVSRRSIFEPSGPGLYRVLLTGIADGAQSGNQGGN